MRLLAAILLTAGTAFGATDVTFLMCYSPDHPEDPATKQILRFTAAHPEIRPFKWGGLTLPGGGGRAAFMLALAGGTAPDVYKAWFHILRRRGRRRQALRRRSEVARLEGRAAALA